MQDYEQVVLVGHSYGCYLVTRLASAAEAKARVAAVLLIGAGYPVPGYERLRWIFYLPLFVRPCPLWPRLCLERPASAMQCRLLPSKAVSCNLLQQLPSIMRGSFAVQVLGWLQPYLTDQFIKLAFHPETFHTNPALIEKERAWSNQNPPYMFRCTAQAPACVGRHAPDLMSHGRSKCC